MKYLTLLLLGLLVLEVYCDQKALTEKFIGGNQLFSAEVYKELKAIKTGNFLFCPLSVEIILVLIRMGARGSTGTQLSQVLHLPDDINEIQKIFTQLVPSLKSSNGYTSNIPIGFFVGSGFLVNEDYKSNMLKYYGAGIKKIDFFDSQAAAKEINIWISNQTLGKIYDSINSNMFTNDTKIVLVNALYFNSPWVTKFNENLTKRKPFFFNTNEHMDVDMMEVTGYYRYKESKQLQAKIVEIPYVGHQYSMVVVLPNDIDGLAELENKIEEVLSTSMGYQSKVHVQMPKFKLEADIEFTNILKNLGVTDAFEDYADFSGMSAPCEQPLKISNVVQKAVIEVDEKGTTAAADAAVDPSVSLSLLQPTVYEFNANHPFIYFIKDPNGVMFLGRFVQN